jgi:hypothetical protein
MAHHDTSNHNTRNVRRRQKLGRLYLNSERRSSWKERSTCQKKKRRARTSWINPSPGPLALVAMAGIAAHGRSVLSSWPGGRAPRFTESRLPLDKSFLQGKQRSGGVYCSISEKLQCLAWPGFPPHFTRPCPGPRLTLLLDKRRQHRD